MENARVQSTALDIAPADPRIGLRATGSVIAFDGFLRLYQEGRDDGEGEREGEDRVLPKVTRGEALSRGEIEPGQHFTEPPPRFTEATLVKRLEELGIGRPSTYASILEVLRQRDYVRMDRTASCPRAGGGWSPPSSTTSSPTTSPTGSPPISRPVSTTSRRARRCGPMS